MASALSPSRAADFMQCPLLYRFRVIDKLPEPPSAAAARGTLVHSVLERVFDVPADERTQTYAVSLVEGAWNDLVTSEPELAELVDGPEGLIGWFADAEALVERWFSMENPQYLEPSERECYIEADVDGLTLRGYIDRVDIAADGQIRIVDYKTGRSPSEAYEAKALFQMKFYALMVWRTRGVMPSMLQLVYLGDAKFLRYQPDEADLVAFERRVTALWDAIERAMKTGDWRPRKSFMCTWCAHKPLCPQWGGTPPPLPTSTSSLEVDSRRAKLAQRKSPQDDEPVIDPAQVGMQVSPQEACDSDDSDPGTNSPVVVIDEEA